MSAVNVCHGVGVKQIWGVHHTDTGTDTGMQLEQQGGPHHAFLFMSDPGANTTTVMRLGDGMDRVLQEESSGIMFTAPTLAAGNVLNYTRVVQVWYMSQLQRCDCTLHLYVYALPCPAPSRPALPCPCPGLPYQHTVTESLQ